MISTWTRVIAWQPRFVVDFGCGENSFIRELRRRGIDGFGVDTKTAHADIVGPLHSVPLSGGIADAVSAFGALDGLQADNIDAVLAEMHRVGRPNGKFIVAIDMTERTIDWWLDRLTRIGLILDLSHTPAPGNMSGSTDSDQIADAGDDSGGVSGGGGGDCPALVVTGVFCA